MGNRVHPPNPLIGMTYAQAIAWLAETWSDREALVFGSRRWTFRQVKDEIDTASRKLAALDLVAGDKVAVWMQNRPEFLFVWLGAAQLGLVAVLLNTRLKPPEVHYQLAQSDCRAVVVAGDGAFRDFLGDIATICPTLSERAAGLGLGGDTLPLLQQVVVIDPTGHAFRGVRHWDEIDVNVGVRFACETDPNAVAVIAYSSGTTALPKGVMLTHVIWRKAADHGARFFQSPDDRLYLCTPLFSILSTVNGVATFWVGGSCVVLDDGFDPPRMLSTIMREHCTAAYLLPLMIARVLDLPDFDRYDLSSLRTGIVLSTDPEAYRLAHDKLGLRQFITSFGMTETSSACTRTWGDQPFDERIKSHGKPLPDIEVRVVDPETGMLAAAGDVGEIQVRGYNIMRGYYKKPEETARAFTSDGWYRTGDAGLMHADGSLQFLHRLSDGYKHKGFNVSTTEVEFVLQEHPAIERAVVVGIPDLIVGELGAAFLIPSSGVKIDLAEIRRFVSERLASFKVPAHLFVVDSFPMTGGTEKVQKFKLRERVIHELAARSEKGVGDRPA